MDAGGILCHPIPRSFLLYSPVYLNVAQSHISVLLLFLLPSEGPWKRIRGGVRDRGRGRGWGVGLGPKLEGTMTEDRGPVTSLSIVLSPLYLVPPDHFRGPNLTWSEQQNNQMTSSVFHFNQITNSLLSFTED